MAEDSRESITDLYMTMCYIADLGKMRAEKFKEVYGDEWQEYDTHGYVQSFLDGKFVF